MQSPQSRWLCPHRQPAQIGPWPRPPLPREVEQYDAYTFQRLYVTPGLSCYWQIQPHRNELSFEEWVDLDIKYIRERSFITDWKIIFRTVAVMLTRQGE